MTKHEVLEALLRLDEALDSTEPYESMLKGSTGQYLELLLAHANGHHRARHDLGKHVTRLIGKIKAEGITD